MRHRSEEKGTSASTGGKVVRSYVGSSVQTSNITTLHTHWTSKCSPEAPRVLQRGISPEIGVKPTQATRKDVRKMSSQPCTVIMKHSQAFQVVAHGFVERIEREERYDEPQ